MDNLQSGIAAFKSGKREDARKYLIAAVKENPKDENSWGWLYQVANNDNERIECLKKVTAINPNNEKAKQLLNNLLAPPLIPTPEITSPPQQKKVIPPSPSLKQINSPSIATKKNNRKLLSYSVAIIVSLCLVCVVAALAINTTNPSQPIIPTPQANNTSVPGISSTPIVIQTEIPANTPQPTLTPQQISDTYAVFISEKVPAYTEAFLDVSEYVQQAGNDPSLVLDDEWRKNCGFALGILNFRAEEMVKLEPTPKYVNLHSILLKLADETYLFTDAYANGVDNLDSTLIDKAGQHLINITTLSQEATSEMERIKAIP
jgi:tetratricopeptide (TPR) repeat protein